MTGLALAATCAAAGVALMAPGGARTVRGARAGPCRWPVPLAALLAAGALMSAPRSVAVVGVVVVLLVLGASRLVRRARAGRRADATRARVIELCDALCAELAAGQGANGALERAAVDWDVVAPVARAAAAGGDVTGGLRELADQPGAAALRVVAAAWQVSHRTGHGLATTLGRVAEDLRAAEQTRRVVAGELASARATARLLAALPLVALAMASGSGASPWPFLLGHPAGLACLGGGLGLGYAGLSWVEALARDVDRLA
jgi:tight adherence protein B